MKNVALSPASEIPYTIPFVVGVRSTFLMEVLEGLDDEEITLKFVSAEDPIMAYSQNNPSFQYIFMPTRIETMSW
jgi:DNA polymerase III sliding clamp (beta) subunit (PCNA family)